MARVLCLLPFAAAVINGFGFEPAEGGMLSEELPEDVAANFLTIPGYQAVAGSPPTVPAQPARDPADSNGDGKVSAAEKRAAAKKASTGA